MRVLAMSNDPVRLSFLTALLADAGIAAILLDAHTSAVEGSIGAIPRRLMVAAEDEARARKVLAEAGETLRRRKGQAHGHKPSTPATASLDAARCPTGTGVSALPHFWCRKASTYSASSAGSWRYSAT